jgi:prevent-host-death family protein
VTKVSVYEARKNFSALLERVSAGEEVAITRYGKVVAKLVQETEPVTTLPDLSEFRSGIKVAEGKSLDNTVQRMREEYHY